MYEPRVFSSGIYIYIYSRVGQLGEWGEVAFFCMTITEFVPFRVNRANSDR